MHQKVNFGEAEKLKHKSNEDRKLSSIEFERFRSNLVQALITPSQKKMSEVPIDSINQNLKRGVKKLKRPWGCKGFFTCRKPLQKKRGGSKVCNSVALSPRKAMFLINFGEEKYVIIRCHLAQPTKYTTQYDQTHPPKSTLTCTKDLVRKPSKRNI